MNQQASWRPFVNGSWKSHAWKCASARRKQAPNIERLREALTAASIGVAGDAAGGAKVARLLIRRLIGPLELYDASKPEHQMPDFIQADCAVSTELLEGLADTYNMWRPHRESNPGLGLERAAS